jgi:hypothetical protein
LLLFSKRVDWCRYDVMIGAAAACTAAAAADPHRATELAGPLRACLEPTAPVPARVRLETTFHPIILQ